MSSTTVQDALAIFLKKHNIEDITGGLDEVVLDYIVSILEDLGESGSTEEVDGFIEMMEAYIPGFSAIDSVHVCEWMFELAGKPSKNNVPDHTESDISFKPTCTPVENTATCLSEVKSTCNSFDSLPTGGSGAHCLGHSNADEDKKEDFDSQLEILSEMFPDLCNVEVKHCLMMASWDTDKAVQLLLHRQQTGDSILQSQTQYDCSQKKPVSGAEEKKIKEQVLAKYGYVDEMDDKVVHKPITPKQDKKKMVRYLNGRVVSTKGEKFTEIKKVEDGDMKKTYINLKPARKYRFH